MTWTHVLLLTLHLLCERRETCPNPTHIGRLHELVALSVVTSWTAQTDEDACDLIAIDYFESGFSIHAVGPYQEWGPWQLYGRTRHERDRIRAMTLRQQATEALRRLHEQGWCGYAGELYPHCPKGYHRRDLSERLLRDDRGTRHDGEGESPLESRLEKVPERSLLIASIGE
jgi:hypothetical protein